MRITQNMLASNSLRHLSNSYERLGKYQDQLSTGKKITKASDDPIVAMKGMHYRSNLGEVEQYQRNLSEAYLWMDNSEAGLEQANSGLQRVRELIVQGKNGTNNAESRQAIAKEIGQLKEDLVAVANTQVSGRYLFNGTKIDEPPVLDSENPLSADPNTEAYEIPISDGVKLKANINAGNVFNEDLFTNLENIIGLFEGDYNSEEMDAALSSLDNNIESLQEERSDLGARYNRLEMIENRLGQREIIASRTLSDNEDADMEEVIMNLTSQESVHRAALSVGARIIQPTLMDFLR